MFSIGWKVEFGQSLTFQDQEDKTPSTKDLFMSVTTNQVCMVEINDYSAFLQNPNTKINVWVVGESSS